MYDRDQIKILLQGCIDPLVKLLVKLRVTANFLTFMGLLLNFVGACVFIRGGLYGTASIYQYIGWGGFWILMGGLCDMLDGQVARTSGTVSKFGALFDSVLDRYSEIIMFFGMGVLLVAHQYHYTATALFFALAGSLMVSYVRARAEGMGISCSIGFMQRPERIILLTGGALLTPFVAWFQPTLFDPIFVFIIPIFVLAVLSNITAIRRLYHGFKESEK